MYKHRILFNKIHRKFEPQRFIQEEEIKRWYKDGGDKHFRYTYPLSKDSIAIDVGAYEGEWAEKIYKKYGCTIYAFEPVREFYLTTKNNLKDYKKIKVYQAGLSGRTRSAKIYLDGVSSSIYKKVKKPETIRLMDIKKFLDNQKIDKVNLIKINIEGGEYELLERMLDTGIINKFDYIQVQFHNVVPAAEAKMQLLQTRLSKTHRPTYQYWFIWDSWKKKGI